MSKFTICTNPKPPSLREVAFAKQMTEGAPKSASGIDKNFLSQP